MTQSTTDAPTSPSIPGVVRLDPRGERLNRIVILILTLGPLAGFVTAVVSLWGRGMSALDAALLVVLYVVSGLGTTVGYHRLLTHGSFDTPRWMRGVFAVAGSLAVGGSVISWVAAHRRHHAFADKEGDPHSPHLEDVDGIVGALKGLWHAHTGWLFDEEKTSLERWAPDLLKDPMMRKIDRLFPLLSAISLVLPGLVGLALTRSWWGGLTAFLWGGLARTFLLHHVTWSVNSICHYFGRRPFKTTDESTNNWPLALISFGESWHNNHHAFPSSAMHGLKPWQVDPGAWLIVALERLGVARDVKRVTEKQLTRKKT